jgi:hypothetical protein
VALGARVPVFRFGVSGNVVFRCEQPNSALITMLNIDGPF